MFSSSNPVQRFAAHDSRHPKYATFLRSADTVAQILGIVGSVILHGLSRVTETVHVELGILLIAVMLQLTVSVGLRYRWSLARQTFRRVNLVPIVLSAVWLLSILGALLFAGLLPAWRGEPLTRFTGILLASDILILIRVLFGTIVTVRRLTAGNANPALLLVSSFAILMIIGTGLLMLPRSRMPVTQANGSQINGASETVDAVGAPFDIALFTATSASCVTGLVVVNTGTYWSPFGQTVILCLFQIGGLGIMTCGAFFALVAGRSMRIGESATLQNMLESEQLGDVRRLIRTILFFTLTAELIGAIMISGLWADKPLLEQIRFSIFHSVSAFCNAGFSLTENSFVGMGHRWQVWGGVAGLIVIGSAGFSILYNIALMVQSRFHQLKKAPLFHLPKKQVRLSLTTKVAAGTTIALLLIGTFGYFILESTARPPTSHAQKTEQKETQKETEQQKEEQQKTEKKVSFAEAWFQAVTFRTAGFNTVDHGKLQPATKLFAVLLMFIGASPGSTGGGVKTVCFALTMLALFSVLRGRSRVEFSGRTIPADLVNRALTIILLGVMVVMSATMLLVIFENQPDRFLDHLFEATSAFATVGVSTGVTPHLQEPSKIVVIVTMFLGRVGPLTLLIALTGRAKTARYEYPFERITLG